MMCKTMRRAIERDLEIIGEAMNNILKLNPNITITNYPETPE